MQTVPEECLCCGMCSASATAREKVKPVQSFFSGEDEEEEEEEEEELHSKNHKATVG